jgi:hypothetical protein
MIALTLYDGKDTPIMVRGTHREAALRVIPAQPDGAVRRAHLLMRQRDALRPLFRTAWDNLAGRFEADELEGWAGAPQPLERASRRSKTPRSSLDCQSRFCTRVGPGFKRRAG